MSSERRKDGGARRGAPDARRRLRQSGFHLLTPGFSTMRFPLLAAAAALMLVGCASDAQKGLCPTAAVLAPVSALTVFRTGAQADPSAELYSVWMTDVKAGCDFDKDERTADSHLSIAFAAKRAPSGEAASYNVPYFVAVTRGGDKIVSKKIFLAPVVFPAGAATIRFEQIIDSTMIRMARGAKIGDYQILTGLQLTQSQLEYNKTHHHFAP
jgi:hypothetical protein